MNSYYICRVGLSWNWPHTVKAFDVIVLFHLWVMFVWPTYWFGLLPTAFRKWQVVLRAGVDTHSLKWGRSFEVSKNLWPLTQACCKDDRLMALDFTLLHHQRCFPAPRIFSLAFASNLCLTELSCNIRLSQKVPPNNKWCPIVWRSLLFFFESSNYIL